MTQQNTTERRETKISNSEVTPHAVWLFAKSLTKRGRPKAPTAIHSPSGLQIPPLEKANVIADCLENQFSQHDLCEENHEWQVVTHVQALSKAMDDHLPDRVRSCDIQELINSLKLKKACETDGIPNECLRHLPRPLVHLM